MRAVLPPITVVFSRHEDFAKNCLHQVIARENAFKGTNPAGIALECSVRWREPGRLQYSYCLLGMAMGTCHPLMGTRTCLVGCNEKRSLWGTTSLI